MTALLWGDIVFLTERGEADNSKDENHQGDDHGENYKHPPAFATFAVG